MNQYNQNEEKDGYWEEKTENFGVKILQSNGHYKDGIKIGEWIHSHNGELFFKEKHLDKLKIEYYYDEEIIISKTVIDKRTNLRKYIERYNLDGITIIETLDNNGYNIGETSNYYNKGQYIRLYKFDINILKNSREEVQLIYDENEKLSQIKIGEQYIYGLDFNSSFVRKKDKPNEIVGTCKYNDKGEIIYYKDYLGNYFENIMGCNCYFDLSNLITTNRVSLNEDDSLLKQFFSRWCSKITKI